jgi:hypothetical protein
MNKPTSNIDPMSKYQGKRINCIGIYSGLTKVMKINNKNITLILLTDLSDDKSNVIRDHIWIRYNRSFKSLKFVKGDIMIFSAYVHPVLKGYLGNNRKSLKTSNIRLSYTLISLENIKKINSKSKSIIK